MDGLLLVAIAVADLDVHVAAAAEEAGAAGVDSWGEDDRLRGACGPGVLPAVCCAVLRVLSPDAYKCAASAKGPNDMISASNGATSSFTRRTAIKALNV
jgi:hypothetical protein